MNPHLHPPKIKSVAMDQLPTPRTDAIRTHILATIGQWVMGKSYAEDVKAELTMNLQQVADMERELLATQERSRVLRSALEAYQTAMENGTENCSSMKLEEVQEIATQALNHP